MLDMADLAQARLVVELGAGTGSHTRAVLSRLNPEARLLTFEISAALAESLRSTVTDPRLRLIVGSAEELERELDGQRPDVIVSALPFTSLPANSGRRILEQAARVLAPGGTLLVLQYSPFLVPELTRLFGAVSRRLSLFNVPPAFLFACREPLPVPVARAGR
jgi:phospholipid N-methyltransferase